MSSGTLVNLTLLRCPATAASAELAAARPQAAISVLVKASMLKTRHIWPRIFSRGARLAEVGRTSAPAGPPWPNVLAEESQVALDHNSYDTISLGFAPHPHVPGRQHTALPAAAPWRARPARRARPIRRCPSRRGGCFAALSRSNLARFFTSRQVRPRRVQWAVTLSLWASPTWRIGGGTGATRPGNGQHPAAAQRRRSGWLVLRSTATARSGHTDGKPGLQAAEAHHPGLGQRLMMSCCKPGRRHRWPPRAKQHLSHTLHDTLADWPNLAELLS